MKALWIVALGGAAGSVARYLASLWTLQLAGATRFPWATLCINLTGCALAGLVAVWSERADWFSTEHRLLLMTGLLGGFTTFSAFGLETFQLLRQGDAPLAIAYVCASVLAGVGALATVYWLAGR